MESYWVASNKCTYGEEYNIGGETVITVGEFLNVLKDQSESQIISKVDPNLLRPVDVTLQIPCVKKFNNATGWKPKFSFEDSVELLLDYYRNEH
jgi:nucleoside-diphosphate-sugar epimerase